MTIKKVIIFNQYFYKSMYVNNWKENKMKLLKNIFISSLIILAIGCDSFIMKDDKNIETYDDELIMQIQNATNKIQFEYNEFVKKVQYEQNTHFLKTKMLVSRGASHVSG